MNKILQGLQDIKRMLMGEHQEFKVWSETEIKISDKQVGGKVELIDTEGKLSEAPDGEYDLADGDKITVKNSQIESVNGDDTPAPDAMKEAPVATGDTANPDASVEGSPAEEAAETPEEEAQEDADEDAAMADLSNRVAAMESAVAIIMQSLDQLKGSSDAAATKDDVSNFSKEVAELHSTIKQLAKVPVQFSQTTTSNTVKESKEDKLLELAKMLGGK